MIGPTNQPLCTVRSCLILETFSSEWQHQGSVSERHRHMTHHTRTHTHTHTHNSLPVAQQSCIGSTRYHSAHNKTAVQLHVMCQLTRKLYVAALSSTIRIATEYSKVYMPPTHCYGGNTGYTALRPHILWRDLFRATPVLTCC